MGSPENTRRPEAKLSPAKQALAETLLQKWLRGELQDEPAPQATITPVPREGKLTLSFAQERMWFLDQLQPASSFYNMHHAVRLQGRLNVTALEQCLAEIQRRHEALRTTFGTAQGQPVQIITPAPTWSLQNALAFSLDKKLSTLPIIELADLLAAERTLAAQRLASAEAQRPFDLAQGPLLRTVLLRLAPAEHLLLVTMHHIIADGWSIGVLIREVAALYTAFATGTPSPLNELTIQYADFAEWQREWLQGAVLERQLNFWKERLAGAPAMIDLPTTRRRAAVQSFRGARAPLKLSPQLSRGLLALSQREGASLFMTLLAGWQAQLYRESGQPDVVVGTRVAGRTRVELEDLIGCFVNVLVMRARLAGNPTFRQLLADVREMALGAFEHQDLPIEFLVKELQPERSLTHTPLFNVMFVLHKLPMPVLDTPGLSISSVDVESTTAKYDLDLTLWDGADGIAGWLEYNTDLFDAATISRLLNRFEAFLTAVVANPDVRLEDVPLVPATELHQLLIEYNNTAVDYPRAQLVPELFEAQVARTPDAVAVVADEQQVTYSELNRRANQLARHLRAHGVGPEVPVGVLLPRSSSLLVALVGIMKAGGVYVPLDASYPATHLHKILTETRAPVVLTQAQLSAQLPTHDAQIICLDSEWSVIAKQTAANLAHVTVPRNLAYVMYTSGSTGEPKGVAVEHEQLLNRLWWMWRTYPFAGDEVLCQRTTSNFSVSLWELLGALLQGVKTSIVADDVVLDGQQFIAELARLEVTRIVVVPSLLRMLLEQETKLRARVPSLKLWSVCGEPLPVELYERFCAQLPEATLLNQYGASEMNDVCWYETGVAQEEESLYAELGSIPIGKPISNLCVYLLDWLLRPVALGQPGEVYVRSISPARGYLNRPELTAERFIPDDISGAPGGRLYRMGDVARYLPGGVLEHLGRRDHQVKVNGMRVELKGVEAVLRTHPLVREAVVTARNGTGTGTQLLAYVCPHEQAQVSGGELREYMRARLPAHMLPAGFVLLAALPLLPNGKVDRKALPEPYALNADAEAFVAPRTPVEECLAAIWAEVLGIERVGVNDRFFDLGGHSLLATKLMARVRDAFKLNLPLHLLFDGPTVAQLAVRIAQQLSEQRETQETQPALAQIVPAAEQRYQPFPLTDIQQAYWIGRSEAFELGNVAAHSYLEFESDSLDLPRFNLALQKLITRHDMLRAIILPTGQQQILPEVPPYVVETLNLIEADAQTIERELHALRERMSHQVLPSDQWPLFELRATRLPGGLVRLHVSFDLLFADAWSWQILGRELLQFYADPTTELEPLELSFRDYVLAEDELQHSELYRQALAYWQSRLPALPPAPDLPLAQNPGTLARPRFKRQQAGLEAETWQSLKAAARRAGLTPSGLLLAAFAEVLTTWSKSPRFTINLTLFNRHALHPQVNKLVGDFTSLNLLSVDNSAVAPFEVRARRLQQQLWTDLDHRYASGIRVLRELARAQGRGQRTVMPVVFTSTIGLEGAARRAPSERQLLGRAVYNISQTPQVWLDHQVHEQGEALVFNWDTVETLFPAGLVEDMFAAYCRLLERLARDATSWQETAQRCVPPAQLAQRAEINATAAPVAECLLHSLFAAQVAARAAHPAVIAGARTLTYEELARRANQLAHKLRALGARPNTLVAVVMEKGWEQVVGVLGILEAGAAYLPISAGLPKERLWYLLEHGEVKLALTQSWLDETLEWPAQVQRVSVDLEELPESDVVEPLAPVQTATDLAYVIYTSGSTGQPKGVMIDHRGAVNTVLDINQRFDVQPHDRVLALSSLSFDLSVYDIFGLLAAGGTIVMPDAGAARDPAHWAELVARARVTIWNSVPALMKMLTEYAAGRGELLSPSLRLVMLSGDWLPVNLPDQIKALVAGVQVVSLGGATEASIWSILYPIAEVDPNWRSIPYGRPMLNQRFHVLDEALEPRAVWVPGQLYIGGIGLAQGYWHDEEKTRASFFTHPLTGERLYRTGDLGRYLPDGNIEFLGREDFQVKIQGYRIELGEIEAALLEHPAVRAAVVTVVGDQRGSKRLVAYIVAHEGSALGTDELRGFLKEKLPEYMIPAAYKTLAALPLTSNGKVDRKALPQLAPAATQVGATEQTNEHPILPQLARLVEQLLGVAEIEAEANLLDFGASSVDMIRIANVVEKELGFRPNIEEFYREPTLLGLALAYERQQQQGARVKPPPSDSVNASFALLKDPQEREAFKRQQPGLRRDDAEKPRLPLSSTATAELLKSSCGARRTHRHFAQAAVPFAQFSSLLSCLRQLALDGQPKYLYPSAGGIYPVQTYLHVKAQAIETLAAGTYYYHPVEHQLVLLNEGVELPANIHDAFINRPVFAEAAFSLFLIGQMSAIAPLYGKYSLSFATLEAGAITQLLMMSAPACQIGLCPIGIVDFQQVQHLFALDDSHVLLHSLLGGALNGQQAASWTPVQEAYQQPLVEAPEREEIEL